MATSDDDRKEINRIVTRYKADMKIVETMLGQLRLAIEGSTALMSYVHSLRWRVKDPDHLKEKLARKLKQIQEEGDSFDINAQNYMEKINDLAGLRILHLHTTQIEEINKLLEKVFHEQRYQVIEHATARTWDIENKKYYESLGIATIDNDRMYTSVHYVVSPSYETKMTCEIQVRTLAEELWGEVDHSMNYPHKTKVETCRDQLKVLARITSSCSRLVDSIYAAAKEGLVRRGRRAVS